MNELNELEAAINSMRVVGSCGAELEFFLKIFAAYCVSLEQ